MVLPNLKLEQNALCTIPLVDTVTGQNPRQSTTVELVVTGTVLHSRFICQDTHPWSTFTERDEPLFQEEVVELFIAPGTDDPKFYFEFEVSPEGVLWDGWVSSPNLSRTGMHSEPAWDCPHIEWGAVHHFNRDLWEAWVSVPLETLHLEAVDQIDGLPLNEFPRLWRTNFYRIDRPQDKPAEYSAWSPTLADPADFHVPSKFGLIELVP